MTTSAELGHSGFERRAYMLDVSRDRVPTNETLEWLVGVLAAFGFNELQLYVEHTFAYAGHEEVWRDASALTASDLRWLDRVCEAAGIDLVANLNCFGHMDRWLSHDRYRGLAECPDGATGIFGPDKMRPGCLAPNQANAELAVTLAREMAATVRHRRIHIGGDEPFELGEGASADEVAERGRGAVYMEHLRRIIEPLVADGHEVMFWADQLRRDGRLIAMIPEGAMPVVWNYEAPSEQGWQALVPPEVAERLGLPDDSQLGFASHARLLIEAGVPFWVAPGTGSWNTLIGRNRNAAGNIADAAVVGGANRSPGFLLTDWGDNGHFQPLGVSLPSMARAGAMASGRPLPSPAQTADQVDVVLGCEPGVGALIDRLGHIGEDLGMLALNGTAVFYALFQTGLPSFGSPDPEAVATGLETLAEARERFSEPIGGPRGPVVSGEMLAVCQLADIGLRRLGAKFGLDVEAPTTDEVNEATEDQRTAWLLSSRPGGLDDSIGKLLL